MKYNRRLRDTAERIDRPVNSIDTADLPDHLLGWFRGIAPLRTVTTPVAIVDGPVADDARALLLDSLGASAIVLPTRRASADALLEIAGEFSEAGSELSVGNEFFVQIENYSAAEYLPIAGPTLLRVATLDDLDAFIADVDAARAGNFASVLLHPMIHIADQCGLAGLDCGGAAARIYIDADGRPHTTPVGPVVDLRAGDHDRGSCATQCVAPEIADAVAAMQSARPWLGRYLIALDVLRGVAQQYAADWTVNGFGVNHVDLDERVDDTREGMSLPFLLHNGPDSLICDPVTHGMAAVGSDAARIAEIFIATCGVGVVQAVSTEFDLPTSVADKVCNQVSNQLASSDVHLPTITPSPSANVGAAVM